MSTYHLEKSALATNSLGGRLCIPALSSTSISAEQEDAVVADDLLGFHGHDDVPST